MFLAEKLIDLLFEMAVNKKWGKWERHNFGGKGSRPSY